MINHQLEKNEIEKRLGTTIPKLLGITADDMPDVEDIDENPGTNRLIVRLTNDGLIEICMTCTELQAMNDAAMQLYDPGIVDEIDEYRWDNNRCEQRHPPKKVVQ